MKQLEWHSVERIPPPRPLIPQNCFTVDKLCDIHCILGDYSTDQDLVKQT